MIFRRKPHRRFTVYIGQWGWEGERLSDVVVTLDAYDPKHAEKIAMNGAPLYGARTRRVVRVIPNGLSEEGKRHQW